MSSPLASSAAGPDPGFPLTLPLRGRKVLVVGGGAVAAQMVTALRACGALVRVVAPTQTRPITELAAQGLIEIANRQYQVRDLAGAWLAFACSEHRSVNAALAFDAEQARIWCVTPADSPAPIVSATAVAHTQAVDPIRVVEQPEPVQAGRRLLVLGGARSGKSAAAQAMLDGQDPIQHVSTAEYPDLAGVLADAQAQGPVLIDCLATWLAEAIDNCTETELDTRLEELIRSWRATQRQVIAVSSEVGWGVEPDSPAGRRFRDELGWLNTRLAAASDEVWLCTAGIATRLR